jgi:hypothetical protein
VHGVVEVWLNLDAFIYSLRAATLPVLDGSWSCMGKTGDGIMHFCTDQASDVVCTMQGTSFGGQYINYAGGTASKPRLH